MIKIFISNFDKILKNNDFLDTIKYFYNKDYEKNILLIPSDPDDRINTEYYGNLIESNFSKNDIKFISVDYLYSDFQINVDDYSIIFLMGGNTSSQNKFILDLEIKSLLDGFKGIIIGMSAGALNICEKTIITPETQTENIKQLKGMGLTDMVVDVHFNLNNKIQIDSINELNFLIYGISDYGAIIEVEDKKYIYGKVYLLENKEIILLKNNFFEF